MDLYYIRHGQPNYENDSITELGHFQAEETAKFLVTVNFDKIFASSQGRAMQTAEHLTNKNHMKIIKCDWAMEKGAWEHITDIDENGNCRWIFDIKKYADALNQHIDDLNWYDDPIFQKKVKDFFLLSRKEIDNWLLSMNIKHENGKYEILGKTPDAIALFAHEGFGTVFFSLMMDMNYPKVIRDVGQLSLCGIYHFRIDENGIKLLKNNKVYYN